MDFKTLSNEELASALAEANTKKSELLALETPTIEQVDEAEAVFATIGEIEKVQNERLAAVKDAEKRFASLKASAEEAVVEETEDAVESEVESEDDEVDADEDDEADADEAEEAVVAASADPVKTQKISAAAKVARKVARPARNENRPVTITAAADVPGFSTGQSLEGMDAVSKAMQNRVKGFGKFNAQAAAAVRRSGTEESLSKFGVASVGLNFADTMVASAGKDYNAVQIARKTYDEEVLTAAGWCAPSEPAYSFLAGYVVDGLISVPEISAPRGGVLLTTGPARSSQGSALDDFGFTQTEAQAEAGEVKTCETIVCPDFEEYRLDAIGYCYKIPFLTQKAYPELITDALKFAGVLYAHKVNRRVISDIVALSDTVSFNGYGPSFTDTLEALSIIALKERRKWSIGVNATLEVKLPEWAREVFRADMSRRNGAALDSISDSMIAKHFVDRRLNVEYVADWQELTGTNPVLPGVFEALIYPAGAVVKAVEDVVNLSAVYDAASLSVNEYTGVFFEQGIFVAKAGYSVTKVAIPVNTAGQVGAMDLTGFGDFHANGSF